MNCTSYVAKTKALISFCVFVFAYAKSRFSHNEAHFRYYVNARTATMDQFIDPAILNTLVDENTTGYEIKNKTTKNHSTVAWGDRFCMGRGSRGVVR